MVFVVHVSADLDATFVPLNMMALLKAGMPITLLADLFPSQGPDSAHIYLHEQGLPPGNRLGSMQHEPPQV